MVRFNALAVITAVSSRSEHIEGHMIPMLEKYGIDVKVNYDPDFDEAKPKDAKARLLSATRNTENTYRMAFAERGDYDLVMTMTDDIVFYEKWGEEFYRVWQETKGADVYFLYDACDLSGKDTSRGYYVEDKNPKARDQCLIFDVSFNPMDTFNGEQTGDRVKSFEIMFNSHMKRLGMSRIVLHPSLVQHTTNSVIGGAHATTDIGQHIAKSFIGDE